MIKYIYELPQYKYFTVLYLLSKHSPQDNTRKCFGNVLEIFAPGGSIL